MVISQIIRGNLGFQGLLLSDDLSMEALDGNLGERAARALEAGCDIALHCNGKPEEMAQIFEIAPIMTPDAMARVAAGRVRIGRPEAADRALLQRRLDLLVDVN